METLALQLVDFNVLVIEVPEKRILMSGREQKEMKRDHEDVQKRFNKQHVYSPQVAVYLQIRESA